MHLSMLSPAPHSTGWVGIYSRGDLTIDNSLVVETFNPEKMVEKLISYR